MVLSGASRSAILIILGSCVLNFTSFQTVTTSSIRRLHVIQALYLQAYTEINTNGHWTANDHWDALEDLLYKQGLDSKSIHGNLEAQSMTSSNTTPLYEAILKWNLEQKLRLKVLYMC